MDISPATIATTASAGAKSPEPETETPTRFQPTKSFSLSNGVLKRHHPHHHHHHHHLAANQPLPVIYKECLKNHAASLGGHALDGCGEFMPSPNATTTDPTSLKCAACGCHRNFHRREPEEPISTTTHVIEYQPHHRHHPPPPPAHRSPNSCSPPPISSSYYPSAPHMLLALSGGLSVQPESAAAPSNALVSPSPNARKRFRTKFTQEQKEKMYHFAERVGWKMQKRDDELVQEFCNEVGIDRGVLKVWMHNNKNTFGKRDVNGGGRSLLEQDPENTHNSDINGGNNNNANNGGGFQDRNHFHPDDCGANLGTNGSSSSS